MRSQLRILTGLIATLLVVAGIALAIWARFVHPFRTQVRHVIMPLPRRHAHLNGITIAFAADLHVGPHFRTDDLKATTDALRRARPDIVIFGGDYVCESPRFIDPTIPALKDMASTARIGSWAILGNHDVANTPERMIDAMRDAGIGVLVNESVEVETEKGSIWFVGIDDAVLGHPDLPGSFRDVPADAATIVLWHEPDRAEHIVPFDPLFMLSGHTHGGQVRLPVVGAIAAPILGKRYVWGRYDVDGMPLYVTSGIGMYRPPIRVNCPPEVVIVTLLGNVV